MWQYRDLAKLVLEHGTRKLTRAVLRSTGEKVEALSLFGHQIYFDLSEGFPLLTTKRMPFDPIVRELIWFLSGSTNVAYLRENGVTIWDEWADEQGELGPVYGKQWRSWAAPNGETIDQIANVIEGIRAVKKDPTASVGRRLVVSAWNPADIPKMALPPCHVLFQFDVTEGRLSCHLYQRSADLFLGVPFNIASYALLVHLIARVTGLKVGELIHSFGDVHIYANHVDQMREQVEREYLRLPTLRVSKDLTDIFAVEREHVKLLDYRSHGPLKGEVAV